MKKKTKEAIYVVAGVATIIGLLYELVLKPIYSTYRGNISTEIVNTVGNQLQPTNARVASIDTRLTKIEEDLRFLGPLIQQAVQNEFKKLSSLPLGEFEKQLPVLNNTIRAARQRKISTDAKLLAEISLKLSKSSKQEPHFWETTASLVTYRSENALPSLAQKFGASPETIPRCVDTEPMHYQVESVPDPRTITTHLKNFMDCRIQLDNPEEIARINALITHGFGIGLGFVHCLIIYRGGDIPLILFKNAQPGAAPLSSMAFENCVYDLSFEGVPSTQGQATLMILLTHTSGNFAVQPGAHVTVLP